MAIGWETGTKFEPLCSCQPSGNPKLPQNIVFARNVLGRVPVFDDLAILESEEVHHITATLAWAGNEVAVPCDEVAANRPGRTDRARRQIVRPESCFVCLRFGHEHQKRLAMPLCNLSNDVALYPRNLFFGEIQAAHRRSARVGFSSSPIRSLLGCGEEATLSHVTVTGNSRTPAAGS